MIQALDVQWVSLLSMDSFYKVRVQREGGVWKDGRVQRHREGVASGWGTGTQGKAIVRV